MLAHSIEGNLIYQPRLVSAVHIPVERLPQTLKQTVNLTTEHEISSQIWGEHYFQDTIIFGGSETKIKKSVLKVPLLVTKAQAGIHFFCNNCQRVNGQLESRINFLTVITKMKS